MPAYAEFSASAGLGRRRAAAAGIVGVVAFQWLGPIMNDRFQLAIDKEVEKQIRSTGQTAASRVANIRMANSSCRGKLSRSPSSRN